MTRSYSSVTTSSLIGVALLAVSAAPALAHANGDPYVSQTGRYNWLGSAGRDAARGGGPVDGEAGARRYVHERYSRDLADGCEYRADVRGTVQPRARAASADLVVNASLHCPDTARVQSPARRISVRGAAPEHIVQRVSEGGAVRVSRPGAQCTYSPSFALRDGTLANTGVAVACDRPDTASR